MGVWGCGGPAGLEEVSSRAPPTIEEVSFVTGCPVDVGVEGLAVEDFVRLEEAVGLL